MLQYVAFVVMSPKPKKLFFFSDDIFYSRCGDYVWVCGIYGHCTVGRKTLSIEDITRNVLQTLTGKYSSITRLQNGY